MEVRSLKGKRGKEKGQEKGIAKKREKRKYFGKIKSMSKTLPGESGLLKVLTGYYHNTIKR